MHVNGGYDDGMNAIRNAVAGAWDSLLGRVMILGLALGWVPFYLLTMAHAALTN